MTTRFLIKSNGYDELTTIRIKIAIKSSPRESMWDWYLWCVLQLHTSTKGKRQQNCCLLVLLTYIENRNPNLLHPNDVVMTFLGLLLPCRSQRNFFRLCLFNTTTIDLYFCTIFMKVCVNFFLLVNNKVSIFDSGFKYLHN